MGEPLFVYEAFKLMTSERILVENEAQVRRQEEAERENKRWQLKQRS